jgi:hypothetical protein
MMALLFFNIGCVYAASEFEVVKSLGAFYFLQFFFLLAFSIFGFNKRSLLYGDSGWQGSEGGNRISGSEAFPTDPSPLTTDDAPIPVATVVEEQNGDSS